MRALNITRTISCFLSLLASLASLESFAQSIVRGPYLQSGAQTSMILRWRTDAPVSTWLEYGLSPNDLSHRSRLTGAVRDHEVAIRSLEPGTRYYYRILAHGRVLAGGDETHYFVTSPRGGDDPFRIWAVGDAGMSGRYPVGWAPGQIAVRDSFMKRYPLGAFQLFMMLGDNAYNTGSDIEYQRGMFVPYQTAMRSSVTWPTQGNHDYVKKAYYDVFSLPKRGESGGVPTSSEFYYSFTHGNVHFVCLNSDVVDPTFREGMVSWLRQDLAETNSEWLVAFWHHPPYSKGSHDSDVIAASGDRMVWMRENILPILESAGVDLVLSGHSHSYERSQFMTGHYGLSSTFSSAHIVSLGNDVNGLRVYEKPKSGRTPRSGTVYVVAGNAGELFPGALNHPAMVKSLSRFGSLSLAFDANELVVEMVGLEGAQEDLFMIRKDPNRPQRVKDVAAKVDPSGCGVDVTWSDAQPGVSYTVYRSSTLDGRGVEVGTVSADRARFKDSIKGVAASALTYSVRARNEKGWGPWGSGVRLELPEKIVCD